MPVRAFICGCSGLALSPEERDFIREAKPWGLILFKRNIDTPAQATLLVEQFRAIAGRDAPVLVDQEGGRVQRLGPPHWRAYPSAAALAATSSDASDLVETSARLMAHDLHALGIDIDCLPVLDVPAPGGHDVIGSRAYGRDPATVARLGAAAARGLLAGGVLPVMKHIPGHGRAGADTHFELPAVTASLADLEASDFAAFATCRDLPMAMTAHVIFSAVDPDYPATTSRKVVERVIRGHIGFDGLLVSDDLSMKALSGSFREKAAAVFAAGVDIALHCNGNLAESREVVAATPWLEGKAQARATRALAMRQPPKPFDPVDAARMLDAALASGV